MTNIIKFEKEPEFRSEYNVITMLENLIEDLKNDKKDRPNKALIIMLNDEQDDSYIVSYDHNLKLSECITLNRIVEARFLVRMGFLSDD